MPTCVTTFGGYEGAVGWIAETVCGETPTGALTGFGYVQNVEPSYEKGMQKGRQINNQKLSWQRQSSIEAGLTVEYVPVDRVLDAIFEYALGESGTHDDHLKTRSIERGVQRDSPAGEERELFNMCKVNTLSMETSVGEPWTFTEELVAQYMQHSDSKTYTGYQSVTVGADPALEADEPLMYYDNSIQISRAESESFTTITGTSQAVTYAPEDVDGSGGAQDDVRVFINGLEDVVVSVVGTTVTWTTTVIVTDTVVINYYKPAENLTDVSDISMEMNRNQEPVRGIKAGLPVVYEFVEKAFEVTASLTQNFDSYTELQEMMDDNYICLFVGVGSKTVRLLHGKFEGPPGPFTPEDLIAVSLDAEFEDVVYN